MKITFLGATKTVTGSNFLVEAAGKKFLVDCGMYQGHGDIEEKNYDDFLFDVQDIDFMLLTHAHIDHSGRIPKLYNAGYRKPIYAQKATCDLCTIMLPDSGHIQEMESEWKNKKRLRQGKKPYIPMYTAQDAIDSLEVFKPVEYDEIIDVDENIKVRFNDAGHMLGSAIIEIWATEDGKETKAVFTGDIGNNDLPLLSAPTMVESADYLVMESTYGNRLHIRNDEKATMFLNIVYETLERNGTVVIPSFAVGRTQEILYELNKIKENTEDEDFKTKYEKIMKAPVYVDSPLAVSATEIFRQNLKHNLWNPNSTILFVGYQAPGTLGRKIVDGEKRVKIFGEEINVNARVEYIEGYSGHADQNGLLNFVYSFYDKPKHIFLVHGEEEGQIVLKDKLMETTGIPVTIPSFGETYTLDDKLSVETTVQLPKKYRPLRLEVIERINTLKEELIDMEDIVVKEKLGENVSDEQIEQINNQIKELEQKIVKIIE